MNEPKPMASLSAGLLARKGDARPAMRRAYLPSSGSPVLPPFSQDDLGWNDMGHDEAEPVQLVTPASAATPAQAVRPAVVEQRAALAKKMALPPRSAAPVEAAIARKGKAAFTLRLDPERHLRLRLACAVNNRSAQQIVTQALDVFLDSHPELAALAGHLPARGSGKN